MSAIDVSQRSYLATAASLIADQYGMRQVIIIALNANNDTAHVVTYGKSLDDCRLAADAGNNLKKHMGWPEELCSAVPERLLKLTPDRSIADLLRDAERYRWLRDRPIAPFECEYPGNWRFLSAEERNETVDAEIARDRQPGGGDAG